MEPNPSGGVNRATVDRLLDQCVDIELTGFDRLMHDSGSHRDTDLDCQILQFTQILDADLGGLFELDRTIRERLGESLHRGQFGDSGTTGRHQGGRCSGDDIGRSP